MSSTPDAASQRIFASGLFRGQTAVVTGGGSGIGLATAAELARLGANVAICGRTPEKLEQARVHLSEIAATAARDRADTDAGASPDSSAGVIHAQPCDIREPTQVEDFVRATRERFGGIDILLNNAGGQFAAPAESISAKGFAAVVRNNLEGTFHVTREVATQAMIPAQRGRIVNITANVSRGFPGMVHTGAARAGVENMTMTLAVEWARYNILVNAVAPGLIVSSGTERYPPALVEQLIGQIPLRRAGTVDEVAAAVLFLASPATQYITGAILRLDGALSLRGDAFPM
jgi:citronellol/citronellal dehydrogenase